MEVLGSIYADLEAIKAALRLCIGRTVDIIWIEDDSGRELMSSGMLAFVAKDNIMIVQTYPECYSYSPDKLRNNLNHNDLDGEFTIPIDHIKHIWPLVSDSSMNLLMNETLEMKNEKE